MLGADVANRVALVIWISIAPSGSKGAFNLVKTALKDEFSCNMKNPCI